MAIWLKFKFYILSISAALAAIFGIYFYGRKTGSFQEMERQDKADRKQSREIENAADNARDIDADPIERLRKHKKLRDL
jgi:hypothetical protein